MTPALRLPDFRFSKTTLPNGLDVIVRRQASLPLVAVNLWYHVGSKNEERRQRGFAHLFEHLMFEGSEHYPGDYFKPLQRLGASVNGSTSTDCTNYFEDLPAAHLELALAMESDRMGHLLPALSDAKLRIQKDVVKNEYRQNYANRPYGMVGRLLAEALYPPDHPYSWLTIGAMEEIEAASRSDVEEFFRRYYVPANASLCLVGDLEEDHALALAERYFGPLAGGPKAPPVWCPDVPRGENLELVYHDRVELERVYQIWPSVPHFHPRDAALAILADVLARGKASRLYRRLVVEEELAQDVSAYQSGRELAGSFGISFTLRPGRDRTRARGLVDEELRSIAAAGVSEDELSRVKNGRLAGFFSALENIGGFGGVADRLNAYNIYLGDPGRITTDFERYQGVNEQAVRDAARFVIDARRVALTVLSSKPPTVASALDRAQPPASASVVHFRPPRPEVRTLRCGVPLWVLPRSDLPITVATLVLAGGGGTQTRGQGGLAELTAAMLDEGTTTRSSQALAQAAEGMGTSLSTSCGWDGSYITVRCLAPYLPSSLDLGVDVLRNPTFPESEWERIRGQTLASLRAERDSAESRAYRAFLNALYPVEHPYRLPLDGAEIEVASFTRDDLERFHARFHGPSRAACIVAGDVDPDHAAKLLDERLSGWAGAPVAPQSVIDPPRHRRCRILLVDRPGAPQAVVRAGHVGLRRLDSDFDNALVLNHVLAGQFTSRLNSKLREEKGVTYGVRSHFDGRTAAGPFSIGASIQSDRVGEALEDLRLELLSLLDDRPVTPAELDDARRSLIEGQARYFETPAALVSRFASLHLHGLPLDDHERFAERLEAVTTESLAATAFRQIHPDSLVVVVAADAALVRGPLEKLVWGELEVTEE